MEELLAPLTALRTLHITGMVIEVQEPVEGEEEGKGLQAPGGHTWRWLFYRMPLLLAL